MFVVLVALCFLAPLLAFVRGAPSAEVAAISTTPYIELGLPSSSPVLPIISAPAASGERNVAPNRIAAHIPLSTVPGAACPPSPPSLRWRPCCALIFLFVFLLCAVRALMSLFESASGFAAFLLFGAPLLCQRMRVPTAVGACVVLILLAHAPCAAAMQTSTDVGMGGCMDVAANLLATTAAFKGAAAASPLLVCAAAPPLAPAATDVSPSPAARLLQKRPHLGRFGAFGRDPNTRGQPAVVAPPLRGSTPRAPLSPIAKPPRGSPFPPLPRAQLSPTAPPPYKRVFSKAPDSAAKVPLAAPFPRAASSPAPKLTFASFFGGAAARARIPPVPSSPPNAAERPPEERPKRARSAVCSSSPPGAAPPPARVPPLSRAIDFETETATVSPASTISRLFEGAPLSIVTPAGTATLHHSHAHGFAWSLDNLSFGDVATSSFLRWLRPFLTQAATHEANVDDSTHLVELIRFDNRPRRSVCLAVTRGQCDVIVLLHNLSKPGSASARLAARLGDILRKHASDKMLSFVDSTTGLLGKVCVGLDALFRGGDKTPGFVERLALESLGVTTPAAVLAAVSLREPLPPFTPPLRQSKPVVELPGPQMNIAAALLGATTTFGKRAPSKQPLPSGGKVTLAEAASTVRASLLSAVAGAETVIAVAPVAGETLGSGPPALAPSGGLSARVICAASKRQVLEGVKRVAPLVQAATLVEEWSSLSSEEEQQRRSASFMASVSAIQLPPAVSLSEGASAKFGSADVDCVHQFATSSTFPLLGFVKTNFPLPHAFARDLEDFNGNQALLRAPTSLSVSALLRNAGGAESLTAARAWYLAKKTPVAASLARQCAAISAALDPSAVAIVYGLQQFARLLCPAAAAAMEGVMVNMRLAHDRKPPSSADPTVCKDLPLDLASGAYCCLSNPADASGLPLYLQLHVSHEDLHTALEDVVRAAMFLRPDYRNSKLLVALSVMGDQPLSVPGGMLLYVAAVALLVERKQLGAHAPMGSVQLLLKCYNNKVYESSVGVDSCNVAALPSALSAVAPTIADRLLSSSSPSAFLVTCFSGPSTRTVMGVGYQFTAAGSDGTPLLWNVPAASVCGDDKIRRLLLGAPAAAVASKKLLFPPAGDALTPAGDALPPAGDAPLPAGDAPLPLLSLGTFNVGGLPPYANFFMASFPLAAKPPASGAQPHCTAMQVYSPTLRPASTSLKSATDFSHWLKTGSGGRASIDLGLLSSNSHRAVTALTTTLAHACLTGPVSRMENSYELPLLDVSDTVGGDVRECVRTWLSTFLALALNNVGNAVLTHGVGVSAPVALNYVRLEATGLLALQTLTCAHIRRAHAESNSPLSCALYDYLRQVNGALRNLLSGSYASSMYPHVVHALGRPSAVPFPPRCLLSALRDDAALPVPLTASDGPGGVDVAEPYALFSQLESTARHGTVKGYACSGCHLTFTTLNLLHEHLGDVPAHRGSHLRSREISVNTEVAALRAKLSPSQDEAVTALVSGSNVLVIGHAGYGKSFLLDIIIKIASLWASVVEPQAVLKPPGYIMLEPINGDAVPSTDFANSWISKFLSVTSSTNATAANLGPHVQTYHAVVGQSSFLSGRTALSVKALLLNNADAKKRLQRLRLLFVDEFARLSDPDVRGLHLALCELFDNNKPFGGLQICFLGDPAQPVDYDAVSCALGTEFFSYFGQVIVLRECHRSKCPTLNAAQAKARLGEEVDVTAMGEDVPPPVTYATLFPTATGAAPANLCGELPDFSSTLPIITLAATNAQVNALNELGVRHATRGDSRLTATVTAVDIWRPPRAAYSKTRAADSAFNKLFFNVPAKQTLCVGAPAILTARAPVIGSASMGNFIQKGSVVSIVAIRLQNGTSLGAWPPMLPGGQLTLGERGFILVASISASGAAPVYGLVTETESDCQERASHQPTHRGGFHLLLCFALSIFRSQGLEFPYIYVDATGWFESHGFLYLCLTRVKGTFKHIRFLNNKHLVNYVDPALLAFCEKCERLHDSSRLLGQAVVSNASVFVAPAGSLMSAIADCLVPPGVTSPAAAPDILDDVLITADDVFAADCEDE